MKDANEFGDNVKELLRILKKILKSQKLGSADPSRAFDQQQVNLNLCFFTFLPLTEEEFADFEGHLEECFAEEEILEGSNDLKFEITGNDLEFLKKNGLKF